MKKVIPAALMTTFFTITLIFSIFPLIQKTPKKAANGKSMPQDGVEEVFLFI